ncbi:cytochrome P450 78A9 [Prunus yedoensis var. nudiflora]|uniref:Cytochrome P450 78A9 n=1 Tax=Prunus yedoensis var. nudiflora TaxID=2094558 RepID=A0A314UL72_PRUYE|nr:cytochrome P450 78A9 [Prunus yedoensis var. nudiflora]
MKTDIESLWVFALASKSFRAFSAESIACTLLLVALTCLAMTFIYWSHPGGPAWGRNFKNIIPLLLKPSKTKPVIPGPRGLPLIGSMALMTSLAHRKIAAMARSCNAKRLMAFSLGQTRVVVTCHPDVAREILNSSVFADRPVKESAYSLMFNRAIGFAPYGVYWRTLRRISAAHLFSPKQIKNSEVQRREIASQMVAMFGTHKKKVAIREVVKGLR